MLYFKCPTCKTDFSKKQILLEEGLLKICNDTSLTKEKSDKAKQDLLDKLKIINYCCKMRAITYVDLITVIH